MTLLADPEQQQTTKSDEAIIDDYALFFKSFRKKDKFEYMEQIEPLLFKESPSFYLDYNDLVSGTNTEELSDLLHHNADKALMLIQAAVKKIIREVHNDEAEEEDDKEIPIRITNWDVRHHLRDINTNLEGRLVTSNAVINRCSEKKPFLYTSVYICIGCSSVFPSSKNQLLKKCPSCGDKLVLHKKKSKFTDSRYIHVQELPEELPAGNLPTKSIMRVFGSELARADKCRPGSRVSITYIVRFDYESSTMSDLKTHDPLGLVENFGVTLKLVLDVNNIEKKDLTLFGSQDGNNAQHNNPLAVITKEFISKLEQLKQDRKTLEKTLIQSFAPHIYGHDILKESILLQLAGAIPSTNKNDGSSSSTVQSNNNKIAIPSRGDMHMLLVGNPGIAKSRLLEFAALISPRCIKTTGRGSTAAGLTAAVVKDDDGKMMLEAGAVVLGDLGLTVIDEFDKLRTEDRSALHEAMEQQTVSISKGGIIATMPSRTSILAAANPVFGTYDLFKSISENTELPPSLLSRFDLIFAMPDIVDDERDRNIAKAMLTQHRKSHNNRTISIHVKGENSSSIFPIEFLAKYLYYVRHHFTETPALSEEAEKLIEDQYSYLRKFAEKETGMNVAKTITVTPRIVDALYRLSVARARLLLKDQVDESDVQRAIYLINEMYKSFGIDIENGKSNLTLLYGAPLTRNNKNSIFLEVCNALSDYGRIDIGATYLIEELVRSGRFTEMEATTMIRNATNKGILDPRRGNTYYFNKDMLF